MVNIEDLKNIRIDPPDATIYHAVLQNWDHIAKPLDSMGSFERMTARIGAIQGTAEMEISKRAVIVMCADHGVVEEGISQSGQEITAVVTHLMGEGRTSVGRMAAAADVDVIPVDIGVNSHEHFQGVLDRKIVCGTKNFAKEPAMTKGQALTAIQTGIDLVSQCKESGYRILATGEMGIGNTTMSSAVAAALIGCSVDRVTGRGAGLDDKGLARKIRVIQDAIQYHELSQEDPFRILCCVGGFDLVGLTGVFLGGALSHIPVVIDGVISAVAALAAERLCPGAKDYMLASHKSREPAVEVILKELQLTPVIDAGLALGEGTGAVMLFPLLDLALSLYQNRTTFQTAAMEPYHRFKEE